MLKAPALMLARLLREDLLPDIRTTGGFRMPNDRCL